MKCIVAELQLHVKVMTAETFMKDLSLKMYEWLELIKFYAMLTHYVALAIERQHGPCLKDIPIQDFSINRKRHLKI